MVEVFFYISSWSKAGVDPDPKYDADPYPEPTQIRIWQMVQI
jgi:hypothetical protein